MSEDLVHLALIMDGNGRWAEARGKARKEGHNEGGRAIERILKGCIKHNIKYLTLYCFSTENWNRPKSEVEYLLGLVSKEATKQIPTFNKNGIRVLHLGSRERLSDDVLSSIDRVVEETKNNDRIILQLALNYGGRDEIQRAINKAIANGIKHFEVDTISQFLDNPWVPEPDFICRSAGEKRLSGFLLYQSNYAEFGFYDKLWPDWDESMIDTIVSDYANRTRKFGEVK